jgi:DNA-binding NtrC family response regulator
MNLVAHDQREYVTDTVHRFGIVSRSPAIADVIRRIELVSATRSTVLITGESGSEAHPGLGVPV